MHSPDSILLQHPLIKYWSYLPVRYSKPHCNICPCLAPKWVFYWRWRGEWVKMVDESLIPCWGGDVWVFSLRSSLPSCSQKGISVKASTRKIPSPAWAVWEYQLLFLSIIIQCIIYSVCVTWPPSSLVLAGSEIGTSTGFCLEPGVCFCQWKGVCPAPVGVRAGVRTSLRDGHTCSQRHLQVKWFVPGHPAS